MKTKQKCEVCGNSSSWGIYLFGDGRESFVCMNCAYSIPSIEFRTVTPITTAFRWVDAQRKAREDPYIGQTCTRCGKPIRASETWSHRLGKRGEPGETARTVVSFYTHEPKCPGE